MRPTIDTLLVKSHLQMSGGDKKLLKLLLCVDVRGLCEKDTMTSEFLFDENLVESMSVAKDTFKFQKAFWSIAVQSQDLIRNLTPAKVKI